MNQTSKVLKPLMFGLICIFITIKTEIMNPYNPEFVEKIKKSQQQYKKGNYTTVAMEDLEKYLRY